MVLVDGEGRIVAINAQAEQLFGYRREELLGQPVERLMPERFRGGHRGHRADYAAHPRTRPMGMGFELYAQRKDGTELPVEISLSPLETENGPLMISAIRDISERKRAETERAHLLRREQLARAEAEAAVLARDQVLAVVSHDLKNPLAAIVGWAQHMQRRLAQWRTPEAERLGKPLTQITAVTSRMRSLELDRHPTDLVALARQAAAQHRETSEQHRIQIEAAVPALTGHWDAARLERVLDNLLSNAIKYSPEGGEIRLSIAREDTEHGPWAVLAVEDDGLGIPAAEVPRVFDQFHRGSNVVGRIAGTGIGLATTRQVVQQHGGTIGVDSREGVGTRFTVRLPVSEGGSPAA
jgi:protein-histidine pros-kinase